MDRTAWIVVILCSGLLFFWFQKSSKDAAEYQKALEEQQEKELAENPPEEATDPKTPEGASPPAEIKPVTPANVSEVVLQNEAVRYTFTNQGAGIVEAELLRYPLTIGATDEFVAMNVNSPFPIGALSSGPKEIDQTVWQISSQTDAEITFATETPEGLLIEKRFQLPVAGMEEHLLNLSVTVTNKNDNEQKLGQDFLYVGSVAPLHPGEWSRQSGMYWIGAKGGMSYKNLDYFKGGGFLGMGGAPKPYGEFTVEGMRWAGVNDQFFTTLVKLAAPHDATIWGSRFPIELEGAEEKSKKSKLHAIEAAIGIPQVTLNPGDQQTFQYEFYIGPKEFRRLKDLGDDRTLVMNYDDVPIFGWLFGWALKPLASLLIWALVGLKGVVGQFGIAIILITIIIRIIIWPVYAKSTRTMKRMSQLNPMMAEIREKYKDDQQKQSAELMKLYKDYGVNPMGGCLPMFIQLPVFLSFYGMLWRAVELRHETFLWVDDLSMPDTLFMVSGFPINLLPIVMAITTFIQMAMTPKTGDKTQRMIFMMMPFFFLVICYNFASALALYWTTQNVFSIGQTWLMNKMPQPKLKKKPSSGSGGKKGFFQKLQEQAQNAQKAKQEGGSGSGKTGGGGAPGASRTKLASERGDRHTKSKKRKKR